LLAVSPLAVNTHFRQICIKNFVLELKTPQSLSCALKMHALVCGVESTRKVKGILMKRFKSALWRSAAVALAWVATPVVAAPALNVTLGTTGVGLEWDQPLQSRLHLRAAVSYARLDRSEERDNIDYDAEVTLGGAALLLDWHPFANGFRLSTGLAITALDIGLTADADGEYQIGDHLYSGNPHLDADVDYAPVAPYFGVGWGRGFDASGWSMTVELGVLLLGDPSVTLDASGSVRSADVNGGNPVDITSSAEFQQDLERERRKLEDDVDDFTLYPVLNLGVSYAF